MAGEIFVSYRRDDTGGYALVLRDRLAERFGTSAVFIDVESIGLGSDFRKEIGSAISSARVLLLLIGKDWLRGGRLHDANDIVRLEIATALSRDVLIIPVLAPGGTMPKRADLPVVRLPGSMPNTTIRTRLKMKESGQVPARASSSDPSMSKLA